MNEEALARWGLSRQKQTILNFKKIFLRFEQDSSRSGYGPLDRSWDNVNEHSEVHERLLLS